MPFQVKVKMIKALFFDIDGTLVSFKTHEIPKSAVKALEKAKAGGVKIFISTGRPYAIINNLKQIEHLIDGYLTTNGAYCFIETKDIYLKFIEPTEVNLLMKKADEQHFAIIIVGKDKIAIHNINDTYRQIFVDNLNVTNITDSEDIVSQILAEGVTQLTPFVSKIEEKELMNGIEKCNAMRWHEGFIDITSKEADKGLGLSKIAKALGFKLSETMAFGDGGNDIAILKTAGIGVAMGGAAENVRKAATYITETVENDGVEKALLHFGVI